MKRIIFSLAILLHLLTVTTYASDGYETGYDDGYDEGYDIGFLDGYDYADEDYDSGYDIGYEEGYAEAEEKYDRTTIIDLLYGGFLGCVFYEMFLKKDK